MAVDRQQGAWLVAAAAALLGLHLRNRRSKSKTSYGELNGAVSFSSRLVAALRALEDREGAGALFSDPLAARLAGHDAVQQAEAYAQVWGVNGQGDEREAADSAAAQPADLAKYGRKYLAGRLAVRTWWFDKQLETAVQRAAAAGSGKRRVQVVVLGAGMDTRPWRHDFLRGVDWYEVDRADVLAAKDAALEREGAQPHAHAAGDWRFPLLIGSRVTLEADLNVRDWLQTLQQAGFDPQSPTVWVAEGLLMYLQPAAVANLLETTSGSSAPGSMLLTQAFVAGYSMREQGSVRQRPHIYRELQSTFAWFCEADPAPFFRKHGWRQPEVTSYAHMAAATGKPLEIFSSECAPGGVHDKMCPFIMAHI